MESTAGLFARHVNAPYVGFLRRLDLEAEIVRAERATLWDADGREFVDAVGGYGNLNVGHNRREVIEAVVAELQAPTPFNWPFISTPHARLAAELSERTSNELECSLIVNSGSEAVESALKLVRLATGKPGIVTMEGAWHGFTLGALSVSEPRMRSRFAPLLDDVSFVPFGDLDAVKAVITNRTGCVITEPIQAESGCIVPSSSFLLQLSEICREAGVILVVDEAKTGLGKTGRMFSCEHDGLYPDILIAGKSLGGGVMPIGAVMARRRLWSRFGLSFAMSSTSAGGNRPACAAALATLRLIDREKLCARAQSLGERLRDQLCSLRAEFDKAVVGVRGRGLLLAIEMHSPQTALQVVRGCIRERVIVMPAFCNRGCVLVEPPLCIDDDQADRIVEALRAALGRIS